MALLELEHISKSFGTNQVLKNVNFQLEAGEVHALLGENGAGKSTMLNIIGGLLEPNGGTIRINGEEKKTYLSKKKMPAEYQPDEENHKEAEQSAEMPKNVESESKESDIKEETVGEPDKA